MATRPDAQGESPPCQLYALSPVDFEPASFARQLAPVLAAGTLAALQIRLPGADEAGWRAAIAELRAPVQAAGVALILEERADLAADEGCDGVHMAFRDPDSLAAMRARLDARAEALSLGALSLGVHCGASMRDATRAAEAGADYVAFGPFFTGPEEERASLRTLARWALYMSVPCVAVGGLTAESCPPLVAAGADFLALCGGLWESPEPAAASRALARALAETPREPESWT